jgi:hypothetical protein
VYATGGIACVNLPPRSGERGMFTDPPNSVYLESSGRTPSSRTESPGGHHLGRRLGTFDESSLIGVMELSGYRFLWDDALLRRAPRDTGGDPGR